MFLWAGMQAGTPTGCASLFVSTGEPRNMRAALMQLQAVGRSGHVQQAKLVGSVGGLSVLEDWAGTLCAICHERAAPDELSRMLRTSCMVAYE